MCTEEVVSSSSEDTLTDLANNNTNGIFFFISTYFKPLSFVYFFTRLNEQNIERCFYWHNSWLICVKKCATCFSQSGLFSLRLSFCSISLRVCIAIHWSGCAAHLISCSALVASVSQRILNGAKNRGFFLKISGRSRANMYKNIWDISVLSQFASTASQ